MQFSKHILIFFSSIFLTACGFHLQGEVQLAPPFKKIYVKSTDPYGNLTRNIEQSLKMSNVKIVPTPEQAQVILSILQDSAAQRLDGISGTQQTRQYTLVVTVVFEVTDTAGKVLVPPQTLQESRTMTQQSNQILGSSNEMKLFYEQMRRSLAYAIMNRLASKEISTMITSTYAKPKPSL